MVVFFLKGVFYSNSNRSFDFGQARLTNTYRRSERCMTSKFFQRHPREGFEQLPPHRGVGVSVSVSEEMQLQSEVMQCSADLSGNNAAAVIKVHRRIAGVFQSLSI